GSFSDLAKLASTPPTSSGSASLTPTPPPASLTPGVQRGAEAGSDDSGIVDFKMIASLDPLAEERAKATPLADQGLFDEDKPAASAPPASASSAKALSGAPVSSPPSSKKAVAAAVAADAKADAKKDEKKKGGSGGTIAFIFGGVILVGAV